MMAITTSSSINVKPVRFGRTAARGVTKFIFNSILLAR